LKEFLDGEFLLGFPEADGSDVAVDLFLVPQISLLAVGLKLINTFF